MIDRDIVIEKVGNIQRCLKRIADVTEMSLDRLDDINIQDVFVLNLQRSVQACIDLAAHIIAFEGLGLPSSLKEHFDLLIREGIISKDLGEKMIAMVGFRNIAVHEYQNIDKNILKGILQNNLRDIEHFYKRILETYKP